MNRNTIKSKLLFYFIPPARGNQCYQFLVYSPRNFLCTYTYPIDVNPNMSILCSLFCISVIF